MKSILKNYTNELVIKNSKFITYLFPMKNSSIDSFLEEVKKIHPKATHYCYAYIYDDIYRYSDDGEPSNTAGLPIYHVLEKEELNRICCIVVRYFGGIKLGAGGLVRAYTKAITSSLENIEKVSLMEGFVIRIHTNYDNVKNLDYLLKKYNICKKEFLDDVFYTVEIPKDVLDSLHSYSYEILEPIYIKDSN